MTLVARARRRGSFRASRLTALAGMALLGLLAVLPARLEAQCTLSGSPVCVRAESARRLAAHQL